MLCTCYSPVRHSRDPERSLPFDLHVLSLPLAFILSQDQTLRCKENLSGLIGTSIPYQTLINVHLKVRLCLTLPSVFSSFFYPARNLPSSGSSLSRPPLSQWTLAPRYPTPQPSKMLPPFQVGSAKILSILSFANRASKKDEFLFPSRFKGWYLRTCFFQSGLQMYSTTCFLCLPCEWKIEI